MGPQGSLPSNICMTVHHCIGGKEETTGQQLIVCFHTTSCIIQSNAPDDGQNYCPKHVKLISIYQ